MEQNNPLNSIAPLFKPHQMDHFQEHNFSGFWNFLKKNGQNGQNGPEIQIFKKVPNHS